MPVHRKGDHTIDCPPIFRCRAHKKSLVFSIEFCEEIMDYAEDRVPGNLNEMTRKPLGNRPAYTLPSNLSNPKVVLFNPDDLQGVDAVPFIVVRVNNRFVGIPARYLDACRFDGCDECLQEGFVEPPPMLEPLNAPSRGRAPSRPMAASKRSAPPGPPKKKTQRMPRAPGKMGGPPKKGPLPANHPGRPRRPASDSKRPPNSDSKRPPDLKRSGKTESGPMPSKARRDGPPMTSSGRMPPPPPPHKKPGERSTGRMKRPPKEEMQAARAEGMKRKGPPPGHPNKPTPSQTIKKDLNKEQKKKATEETAEFAPPPREEMEKARQEGIARKAAAKQELAKKQGNPAEKVAPNPVQDDDDYDDFMMFADSADEANSS